MDITVEFPLEIMDELRLAASSGMRQLARGGLEIGGVLFGSHRDKLVRVVNWRSIQCEHSHGPALLLSGNDRQALKSLLESATDEPDLRGLQPVGWFVSHTRSEVALLASDQEVFQEFFPESWQVALVLRPERGAFCRAGFFVRENGTLVRTESSYREFTIEPFSEPAAATPLAAEPSSASTALASRGPSLVRAARPPNSALVARDTFWEPPNWEPPKFPGQRTTPSGSRWIWAIPGLLAIVLAGAIARDRIHPLVPRPISLRMQEHGGQMTLLWDGNSSTVQGAFGGSLEIKDGQGMQHLELSREQLRSGATNYARKSADLEATLILRLTGGATAREVASYVGPVGPPRVGDAEALELRQERGRLLAEIERLKQQTRKNATRAENAESLVRTLEKRLRIESGSKPRAR